MAIDYGLILILCGIPLDDNSRTSYYKPEKQAPNQPCAFQLSMGRQSQETVDIVRHQSFPFHDGLEGKVGYDFRCNIVFHVQRRKGGGGDIIVHRGRATSVT